MKTHRAKHNPRQPAVPTAPPTAKRSAPEAGELIGLAEAVALLRTTRPTFYRWVRSGRIKGLKVGRQWRFYRHEIERFLKGGPLNIELPVDITPLIDNLKSQLRDTGHAAPGESGDNPAREAVELMIRLGHGLRASDIHITTHLEEGAQQPTTILRYRVDGVLRQAATIDTRLLPAIIAEWKRQAGCNVTENRVPQDGRNQTDITEPGGKTVSKRLDLRISFLPEHFGETVTVRILDASAVKLRLDDIDYSPADRERLRRALKANFGVILITGPTGSGKTTVLYSCLNELASPEIKTLTVENPIEFLLPWATQVAVGSADGLTFARALRSILRSDPDVILVGEIRDAETLALVQQAALTGHLVMTTLHAMDTAAALKRMIDIGSDPFIVADSTLLVLSQRLVRRLCLQCSAPHKPERNSLDMARNMATLGGLDWATLKPAFRDAVGCKLCRGTGYRGRTVIAETLVLTPEIGRALRDGASIEKLRAIAVSQGMRTMAADGIRRAAKGETTLDEVLRVTRWM